MTDPGQARSILRLMLLAGWADGALQSVEMVVAHAFFTRAAGLHTVGEAPALARETRQRLQQIGLVAALTEAAAELRDELHRELAFVCCARVLEADGKIQQQEFVVLATLQRLFLLDDEATARLLAQARANP